LVFKLPIHCFFEIILDPRSRTLNSTWFQIAGIVFLILNVLTMIGTIARLAVVKSSNTPCTDADPMVIIVLFFQLKPFFQRSFHSDHEQFVPQVVMGPGQKFLTRVGSIFCGSGRVGHLWFGLEFRKFSLKMSNFSIFFPSGQKKLLQVRSQSTLV